MADYRLIYWPVPFRGQFVRALLAVSGRGWDETDPAGILALKDAEPAAMPVPFMGPPVLIEAKTGFAISQMPAIMLYLGDTLGRLPPSADARAMTIKLVNDANDVLDEVTLDGGKQMWTVRSWRDYQPRLVRWMALWEETARRAGLTSTGGSLFGHDAEPSMADIVTTILWSTMIERFPVLADPFEKAAPLTAALVARVAAHPALQRLAAQSRAEYGDSWCGGQIEASLRRALAG